MPVIDTLVTEFRANTGSYEAGAKRVAQAAHESAEAIERQKGVVSAIGGVIKGAVVGTLGLAAGVVGAAAYAINAAADFQTLTSKIEAVTGSAKRAKEVMSFVDALAIPSTFTGEELAQGALRLEAFGLATEKYLPTVEKLASVFGEGSEALLQYANALGYIQSSKFGEAFESLASAGVSREALTKRGLTFNKAGEYQGNKDQALTAITGEVEARFGKLSKVMQDGPAAKFASVLDQIGRLARQAGNSLLTVLLPVVERVSGALDYLAKSKVIETIGNEIAMAFDPSKISNGFVGALAWMVVIFKNIPTVLGVVQSAFQNMGEKVMRIIRVIGSVLITTFVTGPMVQGLILLIEGFIKLRKAIQAAGLMAVIMESMATGGASLATAAAGLTLALVATAGIMWGIEKAIGGLDVGPNAQNGLGDLARQQRDLVNQMRGNGDPLGDLADDPGDKKKNPTGTDSTPGLLSTIAAHTRRTAEATEKQVDLNKRILGGGDVARYGFSDFNVSRSIGRSRSGSKAMGTIMDGLEQLLREVGGEAVAAERYGYSR